jgi:tetratricopeptide (TPR) repeat protein
MKLPRRFIACGSLVLALFHATSIHLARAADTPPIDASTDADADDLFRKGLEAYDGHRYREAIESFSRAYRRSHNTALLFNIAQAWRLLGDCSQATATYESFVAADPTSPDVPRARAWLGKLRECHEAGRSLATVDAERTQDLRPASQLPPAGIAAVSVRAQAPRSAAHTPTPQQGHPLLVGALGGAAFVLAAAGGYEAWHAHYMENELSASLDKGGTWNGPAASLDQEGRRARIEAIASLSAAALTALAAYFIYRHGSP